MRTSWGVEGKEVTGLGRGLGQPLFGSDGVLWCPARAAELPQLPQGVTKRPVSRVGVGGAEKHELSRVYFEKGCEFGSCPFK